MDISYNLADDSYCANLWTNDIAPRLHLLFEEFDGGRTTLTEWEIQPSLIHGDLWSGNIGSADGKPSIFDPAVYWGHHEAEWGVSMEQTIVGLPSMFASNVAVGKLSHSSLSMETNHSYATRCHGAQDLDLSSGKDIDSLIPQDEGFPGPKAIV